VKLVQLREKNIPVRAFFDLASRLRPLTRDADCLLIINDRLDIALAVGADGVHLGQDDFPVEAARQLAPDLIIGASAHNLEQALAAEQAGASYVNIGPLFPTQTKAWTGQFLGLETLRAIAPRLSIPFTVMGGIKVQHIPELIRSGARTVAVITAVTAADNPEEAVRDLLAVIQRERRLATR